MVVQCGPGGGIGKTMALGLLARPVQSLVRELPPATEIGKVKSVDADGNPPTVTLVDGRTMRYTDNGHTYVVGENVLIIRNADAPYVDGTLVNTPADPVSPTADWFHATGGQTAGGDFPPVGFRFWQGNADPQGAGQVSTGILPADVLIATATSPETLSGSRQWHRPVRVAADGIAYVSGMRPGRPWKLLIVAKNDAATTPPDYDYICTGNNANNEDVDGGKHPRMAVAYKTGTLSSTGTRAAGSRPTGVGIAEVVAVHARAIVDGESIDISRLGEDLYDHPNHPEVKPDGTINAVHTDFEAVRSQTYNMCWIYTPTTNLYTATGSDLKVDYLGRDAIGTYPQFELRMLDWGTFAADADPPIWIDGRYTARTYIGGARDKVVAAYANESINGDASMGAELFSVHADEWQIAYPKRAQAWLGQATHPLGLAVVLRGANTCQPAGEAGFVQPSGGGGAPLATLNASAQQVNQFASSSWSLTMPTHVAGNLLVAVVATTSNGGEDTLDVTMPAGWTRIVDYDGGINEAWGPYLFAFTKIAASGAEAPTVSITGTNTSYHKTTICASFTDATSATAANIKTYGTAASNVKFSAGPTAHDLYLHVSVCRDNVGTSTPTDDTLIEAADSGGARDMRMSYSTSSAEITGHSVASNYWSTVTLGVT